MFNDLEISWIYHPFFGVFLELGWHRHAVMRTHHPELYDTNEKGHHVHTYEPSNGWARVELDSKVKQIQIGCYRNAHGLNDIVAAKIRQRYNLDDNFIAVQSSKACPG